jgi:phosphoribosylaminoimidazole carboxylase PurE protein
MERGQSVKQSNQDVQVAIIMGSDSDYPVMKEAALALDLLGVPHEVSIISAHRTPKEMALFAEGARERGIRVIIAGAGGAAHLPGMVASLTELPVIGVPVPIGVLQGQDALLSIVQMPKGVPVATVAIGNAWNAGILAAQILGSGSESSPRSSELLDRVARYKQSLREQVLAKQLPPMSPKTSV